MKHGRPGPGVSQRNPIIDMYKEREFVYRRADRRRAHGRAAFPIARPDGARVDVDRRGAAERRQDARLLGLELFEDIPAAIIQELLATCPVREFLHDTVVLAIGEPNQNIFVLLSGKLRVHLDAVDSSNVIAIEPGGCIGELSLIDGKPVSAYAVAEAGSRLLIIDQEHFWSRVLPHPGVARNLLRVLTERMRRNNDAILQGLKQQLVLEHIQRELGLAREIQASMLPQRIPTPPGQAAVEVFGAMEPARQVGGDLYDYFYAADGKLCFLVGDVSDKGMAAALFMARTVDIVRVVSRLLRSPGGGACEPDEIIACVNRDLCQNNASFMFVTMFFGVFDSASGELRYCNAGHNPPWRVGAGIEPAELDGAKGNPLGIKGSSVYRTHSTRLEPGQMLFAFSDGITEAMAADGSFFGEQRLADAVHASTAASPRDLVGEVMDAVKAFVGASAQSDDITALALRASRP
jgi:sigma-B regulation protein RsbU (phosphoserine phosphatase)